MVNMAWLCFKGEPAKKASYTQPDEKKHIQLKKRTLWIQTNFRMFFCSFNSHKNITCIKFSFFLFPALPLSLPHNQIKSISIYLFSKKHKIEVRFVLSFIRMAKIVLQKLVLHFSIANSAHP